MKDKQGNISFLLSSVYSAYSCGLVYSISFPKTNKQKKVKYQNNCLLSLGGLKVYWIYFQKPVLPRRKE